MRYSYIFILLVLFSFNSYSQNIEFSDSVFKEKLIFLGLDQNNDKEISLDEAKHIHKLIIPPPYLENEITDISGIEYFVNLDTLSCTAQNLKKVDLNKNSKLQYLNLDSNPELDTIQIDSLSFLSYLNLKNNNVDSINLTHFSHLKELHINYKKELDVTKNSELETLEAEFIPNIDVSKNENLKTLICNNQSSLDLSNNPLLETLNCIALGTDTTDGLKSLDLTNNMNLKELDCSQNNLTKLDISDNVNLEKLICSSNPLKSLDLRNNTNLEFLRCSDCQLSALDVSQNINLTYLHCHFNQIKTLQLTNNKLLEFLYCQLNEIDSLDLTNCKELKKIDCSNNNLNYLDLSQNNQLEWIQMVENPELKNVCVWAIPFPPSDVWLNDWGCPDLNYVKCNTSINQFDSSNIRIFPNPTNGEINIEFPLLQKINSIILTNLNGQVIFKKVNISDSYQYKLDIGKLANGMYELIIDTDTKKYNEKIIKKSGI